MAELELDRCGKSEDTDKIIRSESEIQRWPR